ncbi:phage terminase large subunit family protein (plasmid) [Escherichia coli]|nr:phage terminase large subunit family protein [Escherichia coli]
MMNLLPLMMILNRKASDVPGDKRIEGSVWPKSIRGSTPKVRGTCQIERAASESPHFMRFHVACPHCGEEQYLKFGDKETPFGLKWTPDDPSSVFYLCEHNACVIRQQELDFTDARYICEKTGIWTRDGISGFRHPVKRLSRRTA